VRAFRVGEEGFGEEVEWPKEKRKGKMEMRKSNSDTCDCEGKIR